MVNSSLGTVFVGLFLAEEALYNDLNTPTPIDGDDEGEQLTHVLAAIFIQEYVEENNSSHDLKGKSLQDLCYTSSR